MSKSQTERAHELYGDGPHVDEELKPAATMIKPGKFSDGQDRMGTEPANVHRGPRPGYESPEGRKHREELRERPLASRPRRK